MGDITGCHLRGSDLFSDLRCWLRPVDISCGCRCSKQTRWCRRTWTWCCVRPKAFRLCPKKVSCKRFCATAATRRLSCGVSCRPSRYTVVWRRRHPGLDSFTHGPTASAALLARTGEPSAAGLGVNCARGHRAHCAGWRPSGPACDSHCALTPSIAPGSGTRRHGPQAVSASTPRKSAGSGAEGARVGSASA
jgi:hypothetical protein